MTDAMEDGRLELKATPAISVIIPHLNQSRMLERGLRALAGQHDAPPHEIIVVDNGSREPPTTLCTHFGARLLTEPTPGPGPARSRGGAAARGDIFAFIDSDCVAEPGWLAAIAARFSDPETTVIGGDVRILPSNPGRLTAIEAYESVYGYRMKLYVERDSYTATCNMAVRRAVFKSVGPFAGIGIAEDADWGRRASALGYRPRFAPEMAIRTPARQSFAELARKWDRHIAHDYALLCGRRTNGSNLDDAGIAGDMSARLRWFLRALALAASPAVEIPRLATTDRLSGPHARILAFGTLVRIRLYRAVRMAALGFGADHAAMTRSWRT